MDAVCMSVFVWQVEWKACMSVTYSCVTPLGAVFPLASGPTSGRRCVGCRRGSCNPAMLGERAPASWGAGPRARDHESANMHDIHTLWDSHIIGGKVLGLVTMYLHRGLGRLPHNGIHTFWGQAVGGLKRPEGDNV